MYNRKVKMLEYMWHNFEERVRLKESGMLEWVCYVKSENPFLNYVS